MCQVQEFTARPLGFLRIASKSILLGVTLASISFLDDSTTAFWEPLELSIIIGFKLERT